MDYNRLSDTEPNQQADWACNEAQVALDHNNDGSVALRNEIKAIKLYREATGCSLTEARTAIEVHAATQTLLTSDSEQDRKLALNLLARCAFRDGEGIARREYMAQLGEHKGTLAAVINERNSARRELDLVRKDYEQLEVTLNLVTEERKKLRIELNRVRKDYQLLVDAHDRLTRDRNEQRDQYNMLVNDYHELRDRKNALEDALSERTTERDTFKSKLDGVRSETHVLTQRNRKLEEELVQLHSEHRTVALNYHQAVAAKEAPEATDGHDEDECDQALDAANIMLSYAHERARLMAEWAKAAEASMNEIIRTYAPEHAPE